MTSPPQRLENEAELLSTLQNGETRGWEELYRFYAPKLYRQILMPTLARPDAAQDALAETFRAAMEKIHTYSDTGYGIYPWLARIARNKAIDLHRSSNTQTRKLKDFHQHQEPIVETLPGAEELLVNHVQDKQRKEKLLLCLKQLNPRYKRALELRIFQECSREECAHELEIKVGTFDVLVLRAMRALKKNWEEVIHD
ncbi:MAG: RNA polymerase sigma factor [Polyangiaceae bacterium]|nr:RNA polymerase sigma factor [Polyangiaceae bacterium]